MIQLANDPNASRATFRPQPAEDDAKAQAFGMQRSRSGHAWPFLSRQTPRPARADGQKPASSEDHGS